MSKITISTRSYFTSHLREPKGRGYWMFSFVGGNMGADQLFAFNGTYTAAKTEAVAEAKRRGATEVRVCP